MFSSQDQTDFEFLLSNAQSGLRLGLGAGFAHLDQPIGLWNYIRIANKIAAQLSPNAHILDWGCGLGQMTYLLQQRGFRVTSYDVAPIDSNLPDLPVCKKIKRIVSQESTILPFESMHFDAVLSCGVLEHVDEMSVPGNEEKSLKEIHRVLRSDGKLMIYQLPQKGGWQEKLVEKLKLGYVHPKKYSTIEIKSILTNSQFKVTMLDRFNLLPKNLTGLPPFLRVLYSGLGRSLIVVDRFLCTIPFLRNLAGIIELTAEKSSLHPENVAVTPNF